MIKTDTNKIERAIKRYLDGDFEKRLISSCLKNLLDTNNELRFNNFAYSIRELSRHILHRLAPDEKVLNCSWYSNQISNKSNGITRGQRVIYAVQGGFNNNYIQSELKIDLANLNKKIKEALVILNKYTHVNEDTFGANEDFFDDKVYEITDAFKNLFKTINLCRRKLLKKVETQIDNVLIDNSLEETYNEIDMLSSHHWIEDIQSETNKVFNIDNEYFYIKTNGTIDVKQQFGSMGDLRRGDGVEMYSSFSFECVLKCKVNNSIRFEPEVDSLKVNTDSWYE